MAEATETLDSSENMAADSSLDDVAEQNRQAAGAEGPRDFTLRHMVIAGSISPLTYRRVRELVAADEDGDGVMVWLETVGGSPNDGYRAMLELKNRYGLVAVVVASEAYSAGTMIALGADQLYMGPSAVLGPLDMQIPHPERPTGRSISTLDVIRAMDAIETRAQDYGMSIAQELHNSGFGLVDAVKEGMAASMQMYRPLVEQIDPYLLHSSAQELHRGIMYTAGLLATRRDVPDDQQLDSGAALDVARAFATQFNTHSHAIGRHDLDGFRGIAVHPAERIGGWDGVSAMICTRLNPGGNSLVEWLSDGQAGGD